MLNEIIKLLKLNKFNFIHELFNKLYFIYLDFSVFQGLACCLVFGFPRLDLWKGERERELMQYSIPIREKKSNVERQGNHNSPSFRDTKEIEGGSTPREGGGFGFFFIWNYISMGF